jgi:glycosyltransferase involved in cell wall biosynthesis
MKIVDIVYHCHNEFNKPQELLEKHRPTLSFVDFLDGRVDYTVVRHLNYRGIEMRNGTTYAFFKRPNKPWQIPRATHKYIRQLAPDFVFVHGFVFPLQVIALKFAVGRHCQIVLQHHAELPVPSTRLAFQKIADRCIAAYSFTSSKTALPWIERGVIHKKSKVHALQSASVQLQKLNRCDSKTKLGLTGNANFLWVGRLNANKDPMTVLRAAGRYFEKNKEAKLYMIFQTTECLPEMKEFLNSHPLAHQRVVLLGKMDPASLADWYNACEFFISASHSEAAGYALMEALSAGCIPIVSRIASYEGLLEGCSDAFFFEAGEVDDLASQMENAAKLDCSSAARRIRFFFDSHRSPRAVAENLLALFSELQSV